MNQSTIDPTVQCIDVVDNAPFGLFNIHVTVDQAAGDTFVSLRPTFDLGTGQIDFTAQEIDALIDHLKVARAVARIHQPIDLYPAF